MNGRLGAGRLAEDVAYVPALEDHGRAPRDSYYEGGTELRGQAATRGAYRRARTGLAVTPSGQSLSAHASAPGKRRRGRWAPGQQGPETGRQAPPLPSVQSLSRRQPPVMQLGHFATENACGYAQIAFGPEQSAAVLALIALAQTLRRNLHRAPAHREGTGPRTHSPP